MGFTTRRAVLGTLLRADRPMTIGEIAEALRRGSPRWFGDDERLHIRIAEVLRYQVRIGRAERVRRGVYRAIPDGYSRTTRWRYERWERLTE